MIYIINLVKKGQKRQLNEKWTENATVNGIMKKKTERQIFTLIHACNLDKCGVREKRTNQTN